MHITLELYYLTIILNFEMANKRSVIEMELFDSHAHYNDEKFNEDREEVIKAIYASGVTKLVNAGYSLDSSKSALAIAKKYDWMYTISGISPNDIPESEEGLDKQLKSLMDFLDNEKACNKIVAIGEIGLDYYWNNENIGLQRRAFRKQILIANLYGLPIVIHTREAVMDTLKMLKEHMVIKKGVFHCCPLNRELVKEALKLGFYISFAGPVTFKNAKNADEVIDMVPLDRMLIETDSPYLAPEPNRGKRNDSRNIKYIAEKIANVKQISLEEISKITYDNACNVFEIKN